MRWCLEILWRSIETDCNNDEIIPSKEYIRLTRIRKNTRFKKCAQTQDCPRYLKQVRVSGTLSRTPDFCVTGATTDNFSGQLKVTSDPSLSRTAPKPGKHRRSLPCLFLVSHSKIFHEIKELNSSETLTDTASNRCYRFH